MAHGSALTSAPVITNDDISFVGFAVKRALTLEGMDVGEVDATIAAFTPGYTGKEMYKRVLKVEEKLSLFTRIFNQKSRSHKLTGSLATMVSTVEIAPQSRSDKPLRALFRAF